MAMIGETDIAPVDRVERRVNVFRLTGTDGVGLLAESASKVTERPGVWSTHASAWVRRSAQDKPYLIEAELHSWDAWTEAAATGDRRWLDVPRRRMYAERDRRTRAVSTELDRASLLEVTPGTVPAIVVGLSSDQVRTLAARHAPELLAPPAPDDRAGSSGTGATPSAISWGELERRLAVALSAMAPETFLLVGAPASGHYVQFARRTSAVRGEAVSSHHLPPPAQLTEAQEVLLHGLGWLPPESSEDGGNLYREWPVPPPAAEIARVAVATLRSAYAIAKPSDLQYRHESFGDEEVVQPDLGIDRDARSRPSESAASGPDTAELRTLVEQALAGWLKVDQLVTDADGDYPIRTGSALFFVRVTDGLPAAVRFFSPIVRDVARDPALLAALNEMNANLRFGRVFWVGGQVVVSMELTGVGITAEQVTFAAVELGNLADHLDDVLHGRFGGKVAFDSRPLLIN
jgi:hypothetical protein